MKQVIVFIGGILLLLNILIGYFNYDKFNLLLSVGTIVWTTMLLCFTNNKGIKDGFKVSLTLLFMLFGIIEFVLAIFTAKELENNPMLVFLIILFTIQVILLFVINTASRKIK